MPDYRKSRSELALERLGGAVAIIEHDRGTGKPAGGTIHVLIGIGARVILGAQNNTLRLHGVTGNCTWSKDKGLIDSWLAAAKRKIARLRIEDQAHGR